MIGRLFLGKYQIQRLIGEGGMGRVYLARQTDLGRQVVVKVMHDHIAEDARFRERFQRETLLMARFNHPHAVALYDASVSDPMGPCIVMEYVKGVNLETLLQKNGRFSAPRVGRILHELCEALQAAHDEGIIHRDLKPANLMIVDPDTPKERIKVMDFGLAKLAEDDGHIGKVTDTNVDFAVGTPGYIAPEQVRGETMDHRGDLYSVGVMMYELMAGRLPFQGATGMDILLAHATETPPTFAELGLEGCIPPSVEEVVFACLAKDPEDRPQSARELAERFSAAIAQAQHLADSNDRVVGSGWKPGGVSKSGTVELMPAPPETTPSPAVSRPAISRTHAAARDRDPSALPFTLDAWMPEVIAIRKLRGFVHDAGGEVLESVPGLVRVRLGKSRNAGSLGWLGLGGRKATGPIDVELHLHRVDAKNDNKLTINVLFRPSHPNLLIDEEWRDRCAKLFVELRGYLMGGG